MSETSAIERIAQRLHDTDDWKLMLGALILTWSYALVAFYAYQSGYIRSSVLLFTFTPAAVLTLAGLHYCATSPLIPKFISRIRGGDC